MESKRQTYDNVRDTIHRLLENHDVARGSSTEHSLCILEQKWETVYSKVQERKVALLIICANACCCGTSKNAPFNCAGQSIIHPVQWTIY